MIASVALSVPSLVWICGGGLLLTAGDVFMRYFVDSPDATRFFLTGFSLYIFGLLCLAFSYFGQEIAQASVAMILVNVITLIAVDVFIFNQAISSLGYFAIVLGIVAFVILELFA